jgi:hypothetical protein
MTTGPSRKPDSSKDRIVGCLAPRQNSRHACAHRTNADLQLAFAGNQCGVADFDAFHVCDGVELSRRPIEGDTQLSRSRFCLHRP